MSENINHGQQGVGKVEGDIEKLEQKMLQIKKLVSVETLNVFSEEMPTRIDARNINLSANFGLFFYLFFVAPMAMLFISQQAILKPIGSFLGLSKETPFLWLWIMLIMFVVFFVFPMVLFMAYDKIIARRYRFVVDEKGIRFRKDEIKMHNIFKCYQHRLVKRAVTIYWIGRSRAVVSTYKFRNEAEAYLVCMKIKEFKRIEQQ